MSRLFVFHKKIPTFMTITTNTEVTEKIYRKRADVGQSEGMGNGEEGMWTGEYRIIISIITTVI
jgi:hypothetical protein